jgi:ABC-type branched-subunit amino acid transport system substrate-binding protein
MILGRDMRTKTVFRVLALLAAMALVAAACGDDDEPTATPAPTQAPAPDPTQAPAPDPTQAPAPDPTDAPPPAGPLTDVGVTTAPCDDAVNAGNGCIYLGIISDLTVGPFSALAIPAVGGLRAFWAAVNADGGIGGFDVILSEANTYDAQYDPQLTVQGFTEIEPNILLLAQSLGTSQTIAVLDRLVENSIVTVPATWWSGWAFAESDGNGLVIEAGANYCHEAMNDFDFALNTFGTDMKWGLVYFPNDYGFDYAAGLKIAAEANNIGEPLVDFVQIPQSLGGDVAEAVGLILGAGLDVVFITTGPNEMAGTLGGVAGNGGTTAFIGTHPTWNPALIGLEALVPALEALYFQSDWIPGWYGDSVGHEKAKAAAAAENQSPNEWYLNGWASQYPLKALLEQAIADGDLTRAGAAAALKKLDDVSFEGMVPNADLVNTPGSVPRASLINKVDASAPGGTVNLTPLAVGPTASAHEFTSACFQIGG